VWRRSGELADREIHDTLSLSERTVRDDVRGILSKLSLTSGAQAAAYAARHRIEDYV
jgi:DNA-binding NarL/FixJ family response regulator